jgi:hypothetical protein
MFDPESFRGLSPSDMLAKLTNPIKPIKEPKRTIVQKKDSTKHKANVNDG